MSPDAVGRETGYASVAMVEKVYLHLGQGRHRGEVVEYQVAQDSEVLKDCLEALHRV